MDETYSCQDQGRASEAFRLAWMHGPGRGLSYGAGFAADEKNVNHEHFQP